MAITSEDAGKVEPFIQERGITYPVGLSSASREAYGGGGIPHAYLIAPDGEVLWHGHPASLNDGRIEKELRKAKDFWIRDVDGAVRPAASAFEKGKLGDAERLATEIKAEEGQERAAIADAEHVLERVAAARAFFQARVDGAVAIGDYDLAFDTLERVEKHFDGAADADEAAKKVAELKADPEVKKEMTASKKLRRLSDRIEKASGSRKKLLAVEKKVVKFIDKHDGMKAAARARNLLRAINREKAAAR